MIDGPADSLPLMLNELYRRLYDTHGPQHWWPAESRFEVIVGAILTQSTAWVNVEKALGAMRTAECWSFDAIAGMSEADLASVIRSSGYYNAKARKLQAFANHVLSRGDLDALFAQDTSSLRSELLTIHGIGEETADDIILYAAERPSFVIDSYTRRIVDRLGIVSQGNNPRYGWYQALFQENLPPDAQLFNEYHALLDHHAKYICLKRDPRCADCCLVDLCAVGSGREPN